MAAKGKVIITCATTGSIHTPSMSPHLPITPNEIAEQSIAAAEAGASIIHLHARDPETGRPTPDADVFMPFLQRIKQSSEAVVNITTGGGHGMTVAERLAAPLAAKPEMCSLNMGSMNFGLFPMLDRYKDFKYEWEREHLENSRDFIFRNTFKDIELILKELGEGCGTRFEFECYDVGHLYTLAHFLDRGLVKPPLFVQTIFGILGGIGADPENLQHMKRIADKLFGDDYYWSVLAGGRHQLPFVTMGAIMGGNVRVGLEDSLYAGKGRLATSNAEQVTIIRSIIENLSLEIASPSEAREMLHLKGGDQVILLPAIHRPSLTSPYPIDRARSHWFPPRGTLSIPCCPRSTGGDRSIRIRKTSSATNSPWRAMNPCWLTPSVSRPLTRLPPSRTRSPSSLVLRTTGRSWRSIRTVYPPRRTPLSSLHPTRTRRGSRPCSRGIR